MNLSSHRLILACLAGLLSLHPVAAQEAPLVKVPFDGTEAFGHFLHSFNLKAVARIEDAALLPPEKTLLVIFGDLQVVEELERKLGSLTSFREAGGALLVASDYSGSVARLDISGLKVFAIGESKYKGENADCPVVKPLAGHPVSKDLKKGLATNRPSYLENIESRQLQVLARFEDDCHVEVHSRLTTQPAKGKDYIIASPRDAPASGRMVVLAGHGLFLNGMLIQTDSDNFPFAWNMIQWLSEGPDGPREYALFLDDKKVVERFALPLSKFGSVPIPPLQVINRMLRGLEDENRFNRLLTENVGKEPLLRVLLLVASLVVLILGAWRIMHGRFRRDARVPLVVGKLAFAPPELPVLAQRQEELRRQGNLWEPAQVLVRQFFLNQARLAVPLWDDAAAAPPLHAQGNFWQRRKLTGQVQKLWRLARTSPAQPVSPRQFDDLLQTLAKVSAALNEGRARFGSKDI